VRPERRVLLHVAPEGLRGLGGVLARRRAQAQLRAGGCGDGVGGGVHGRDVHARDRQRGLRPEPGGDRTAPGQPDALQDRRVGPEPLLVVDQVGAVLGEQPLDGDRAVVVVQGRDEPGQQRGRVQDRAAVHARVHGVLEHGQLHDGADHPAQARGQGGHADLPVGGVRDDDDVRGQPFPVGLQEVPEGRGAGLLLPLHEDGHAEAEVVAAVGGRGAQGGGVGHHPGLVVGRAPPVQAAVALLGDERFGVPQLAPARGLDVVVGVEQHGRPAGRGPAVGDDGGVSRPVTQGHAQDLHLLQAGVREHAGHGHRTALELRGVEGLPGDAGDRDQLDELLEGPRHVRAHGRAHGVDGDGDGRGTGLAHGTHPMSGARRGPAGPSAILDGCLDARRKQTAQGPRR